MIATAPPTTGVLDSHWSPALEDLLACGRFAGADLVEVFLERTDHLGVLAEQDTITSVTPAFGMGAGIRVFLGKRDGFVSTNDLSPAGLRRALEQALGMLGLAPSSNGRSGFEGLPGLRDFAATKADWLQRCPELKEATARLLEGTDQLQRQGKHLQARRGSYARDWQEVLVAASDGTFGRDIRLHQSVGLNVLAANGEHRAGVGRRYGTSDQPDDLRRWDATASAAEVCASAGTMLYADYVEAGQMPAVLANRFGGVIFHEACGHLLETTQVERGTTPFAERVGETIAHPAVTAIDEGLTGGAFGSLSMDDEGMEAQRTVLIQNGVLQRFISDRAGELRTGHARTGSGRRQSHTFAAASRMRNTFIDAGPHTPEELIASVDKGLYCKSMGGGSVGPTGQFNFAVEEGYLIENGQLTKPVKGATLIGEAKEVMPRISMCANDLELAAGFCGSVSGSIFVTVGQPHIKVDSITVGGPLSMSNTNSTGTTATGLSAEQLRSSLASIAAANGIRRWDLGAACSTDISVQVDRGEPKQMKGAQRSSITVRVWNDIGLVGVTSTSDLSEAGLERALTGAKEASAFGNADDIPAFSPLATAPLAPLDQPIHAPQGILRLLDTLKGAEQELLARHDAIATVPYNGLAERSSERIYLNSDGACRQQQLSTASLYLYARAEEAGRKPRSAGAVRLAYGAGDLDVAGCINEAAERTISHLNYAPIATGHYTCVFSPEAFLDLIGAFSGLFNARAVLDGVSLSNRESIGETLAVPFLDIHDNGLHPGNIGASAFDGEGTPTQRLALLEGGVLRNFLHSEATARAFGVNPTGHAGMGAKVSVGPDWFEVSATPGSGGGQSGLDRFKAGEPIVWIDSLSALHAGVKASQGSFSLPFDGWLIQGGEPRSIEAATVAGDIRQVLKAIVGFEGEAKITPDGLCPMVWVEGLSITGEA